MTGPTSANAGMTGRLWLLILLMSALWGGGFMFIKFALTGFAPFSVVAGRVGVAALALGLIVAVGRQRLPRQAKVWRAFFIMGALNNLIPWMMVAWAQTQIPSSMAAILNAPTPLLTAVMAHLLTDDEKLTPQRFTGVLAGMLGVALVVGPGVLSGMDSAVLAQVTCLSATVSYAASAVYGRVFRSMDVTPVVAAFGQQLMVAVVIVPLALIVDQPWARPAPGAGAVAAVLALGVIATALPYIIFYRVLAEAGATNLMLVNLLIPGWAVALGAMVLGERLPPTAFLGMAMVGLGLAVIDGRLFPAIWRRLTGRG
ncbi:DMT family transporter [Camelimonas lactis]|uniref:Drug/metabolite transporter (DMT)-like permease n=1 Tax=Camelimonas lactis TaxID=659006 RepID=A0A4V2RWV3_9HYPH|nr:DMT family transporter [Camelimonas lactis]TCO10174.1 drug/metabolite transporter (DMT)-like permease [Camelimonas lactis]